MIKLLTDAEMEAVSGGFRGESFRDFLVGEAGPQRLLAADDLSSSSLGGSAAPLAHIELETESRAETLMAVNFRQTLGWGGASGHSGISQYQPYGGGRNRQDVESIRPSDLSMERRARRPDVQSWKTPFLNR